jgi:hypothetical protein
MLGQDLFSTLEEVQVLEYISSAERGLGEGHGIQTIHRKPQLVYAQRSWDFCLF